MSSNTPQRRVDGILLLDKPAKITSNAALQAVRRLLGRPKAGHTGTLDPEATGLLPICFGEATKFSSMLLDADKTYIAIIKLGQVTSTGDAEGELIETRPVQVNAAGIDDILRQFTGGILQTPPMYSAIKFNGKPLYAYARKGLEVERTARTVRVHQIELLSTHPEEIEILVRCSKGTYIRVLAEDIGRALGCGGHLKALRRTEIGGLTVGQALTLEGVESMEMGARLACLKPVDSLLMGLTEVVLDEASACNLLQGKPVSVCGLAPGQKVRIYGPAGRFLGLGQGESGDKVHPKRLLANL